MKGFVDLDATLAQQPVRLGAVLARIDTGRGREQLHRDQVPELLTSLADRTRVASIRASNAIEDIVLGQDRAQQIAADGRFRGRNEAEFAGYRDAVDEIAGADRLEAPTVPLILHLHRRIYRHVGGRGGYLKAEDNLIVSYEGGAREVVFTPPLHRETEFLLMELTARYRDALDSDRGHPLILLAVFVLDLLAIHPVLDGNGRLSRLVTAHELLRLGYGVSRYVSVEQRIFEAKTDYYQALRASQLGWQERRHDVWPWVTFLVAILDDAYRAFEERVAGTRRLTGVSKQERVRWWVLEQAPPTFRIRDVRRVLPGISDPTITLALRTLRSEDRIVSNGTGVDASWTRLGG